ncbi:hypothetical protein EYF80_028639 [Liparis tanakae]|uniref:Uncharacterized protein n=1 Tax=Liparis tanakae TaxID=230148 RepID=A0A4Z2H649_9TELE|nr:hypothetical protein EYF80_028639 [Liparis tanakae]
MVMYVNEWKTSGDFRFWWTDVASHLKHKRRVPVLVRESAVNFCLFFGELLLHVAEDGAELLQTQHHLLQLTRGVLRRPEENRGEPFNRHSMEHPPFSIELLKKGIPVSSVAFRAIQ